MCVCVCVRVRVRVCACANQMEVFRDAWARLHLYATEAMSTLKRVTRMLEEATANECGHTDESLKCVRRSAGPCELAWRRLR